MLVMVAGPYRTGALDAATAAANLAALTDAAVAVFEKGHIPLIAVHAVLPLVHAAGQDRYEELMTSISLELAERCDACVRIGGGSAGADAEVARFRRAGKPVYTSVGSVPDAAQAR